MALTRGQKEELIQRYSERLERAPVMIWSNFRGITVAQISELRRQLRGSGAELMVVKNTLMQLALKGTNLPWDPDVMGGPSAVTFVYDEVAPAATAVTAFARAHEGLFQVKGGLLGGKIAAAPQIQSLTTLPSREVLLAQVVGGVQAPITGLVSTLAAMMRAVLNVLNARAQQLEGSSS